MSFARMLFALLCVAVLSAPVQAADFDKFELYGGFSYLWNSVNANPGANSFQPYYFNESNLFFGEINLFLPLYHSLTNPSGFQGLPGFEVSGAYNFRNWFGVEFAYQRHSGQQVLNQKLQYLNYDNMGNFSVTITQTPVNPTQGGPQLPTTTEYAYPANSKTEAVGFGTADLTRNTFLIGPKFAWRSNSRLTPFAHALFGVSLYKRNNLKMDYSAYSEYNEYNYDNYSTLAARQTFDLKGTLTKGEFSNMGFAMSIGGGVDLKMTKRLSIRLIQADYVPTRHGFNYKYTDDSTSDISYYTYTTVLIPISGDLTGSCDNPNTTCAYYTQETRNRVKYTGTRNFSYSVPHQFLNNIKLSAGVVVKF